MECQDGCALRPVKKSRNVKRVLITGMSGAGKSLLLHELAARGYRTVDTDYGAYFQIVDGESLWREDRISALLASAPDELPGVLFVQGTTRNQVLFYPRFDHIVLLSAPPEVLTERLAARTTNPYGRIPPSSLRHFTTSRRWNRCSGSRPRSKSSPRYPSCRSLTFSLTTCCDPHQRPDKAEAGPGVHPDAAGATEATELQGIHRVLARLGSPAPRDRRQPWIAGQRDSLCAQPTLLATMRHEPEAQQHRDERSAGHRATHGHGADLDALFDQMPDPQSVWMAAFTPDDPDDRTAFDAHMARVRSSPDIALRAVTCDGQLVGSIAAFVLEGQTEVSYWIDRAVWGRGVASRTLGLLMALVPVRPVHARAASDNVGSLRVLQKSGFKIIGTENSFAPGRNSTIEETILRKD
jgi:RimJ/RimL family protein N-acetyltransferase